MSILKMPNYITVFAFKFSFLALFLSHSDYVSYLLEVQSDL